MKSVKTEPREIVSPDVEITVWAQDEELSAIAFYKSPVGTWDVLVGIAHPAKRGELASVLRWAADAVEAASFNLRPHIGSDDDFPF